MGNKVKEIKVGSDFSGVGAFNQSLIRLGIPHRELFACDKDKYARQTFALNYGEPENFPTDVYEREIPSESLDIFMTSPPCQSFSLAGKRLGKDDSRGILFFNSHEFIQKNKPRFFIFENVKGLLSDDKGKTFSEWTSLLGGKSINGNLCMMPHEDSVPYHIYWKVINAKDHNIPQNRERVFIVGIRDDEDNHFSFPQSVRLEKRLKDVLEENVDEKYFLSDESVSKLIDYEKRNKEKGNEEGTSNSLTTVQKDNVVVVSSNTKKGYDIAEEGDSINMSVPSSKTRRGRVGKGVAQTLDTACNQGVVVIQLNDSKESGGKQPYQQNRMYDTEGINPALNAGQSGWGGNIINTNKIRRLTPTEAFRLMDFNEDMIEKTISSKLISDSQLYKQAGNSICVGVLAGIISKLKL